MYLRTPLSGGLARDRSPRTSLRSSFPTSSCRRCRFDGTMLVSTQQPDLHAIVANLSTLFFITRRCSGSTYLYGGCSGFVLDSLGLKKHVHVIGLSQGLRFLRRTRHLGQQVGYSCDNFGKKGRSAVKLVLTSSRGWNRSLRKHDRLAVEGILSENSNQICCGEPCSTFGTPQASHHLS